MGTKLSLLESPADEVKRPGVWSTWLTDRNKEGDVELSRKNVDFAQV